VVGTCLLVLGRGGAYAEEPVRAAAFGIDAETRRAIDRALEYLYRGQNPDGSWSARVGRKVHNSYWGQTAPHIGATALAGMAFLASGAQPDQGVRERHCIAVRKALDFIMDNTQGNGFISAHGSRMYSHAFATLFLAEALGTGLHPDNRRVRDSLRRATRLIVEAQNPLGGWRYLPGAEDADMSVTVCQVFALRAARNVGVKVPKTTIERAVRYVKDSFDPVHKAFKYQIDQEYGLRSRHSFALTACGLATLYGAGEYQTFEISEGLDFMRRNRPAAHWAPNRFDYFYAHYYAAQAAYQAGGAYWRDWYEEIRTELLGLQDRDGSWSDLVGSSYATAVAAIILQLPNPYLPITES
jgi:hypothetical protein